MLDESNDVGNTGRQQDRFQDWPFVILTQIHKNLPKKFYETQSNGTSLILNSVYSLLIISVSWLAASKAAYMLRPTCTTIEPESK